MGGRKRGGKKIKDKSIIICKSVINEKLVL
jgi:hypothetical protein